jgi:hypothetical protein
MTSVTQGLGIGRKNFVLTLTDQTATVGDTRVEWERLVAKSLFAMAAR